MSTELTQNRETIRCADCELNQFMTRSGNCRRCGKPLVKATVAEVVVMMVPDTQVVSMREVMRRACVNATRMCGGVMRAAEALDIPPNRLKQLLKEAGDVTDYRRGWRNLRDVQHPGSRELCMTSV